MPIHCPIRFANAKRPERLAKVLRRKLAERGHPVRYSQVREALAQAFNYRSWNDLYAQVGQGEAFAPDEDLDSLDRVARQWKIGHVFARALGLEDDVGQDLMRDVAPLSRGASSERFDNDAALYRLVCRITRAAQSITRVRHHDCDGFAVLVDPDLAEVGYPQVSLIVADDGALIALPPHLTVGMWDLCPSVLFDAFGFTSTSPADGEPDPLILATLRRLDRRTVTHLRMQRNFARRTYEFLRTHPDHPAHAFLERYPLMAWVVDVLASRHGRSLHPDPDFIAILDDPDLRSAYLAWHDARYANRAWPLRPQALADAFEAVAGHSHHGCLALTPPMLEYLAHAPTLDRLREPRQAAAALRLAEQNGWNWHRPAESEDRAAAMFDRFKGEWIALEAEMAKSIEDAERV